MSSGVGSYVGVNTGRKIRLEWQVDQTPSTVKSSTSSVSVRVRIWVRTQVSTIDKVNVFKASVSSPFSNASGSRNISTSSGARAILYDSTKTIATSSSSKKISISASITNVEIAGLSTVAKVSGSHTIGAKPAATPTKPTDLAVTRVSDTQHTITGKIKASSTVNVTRLNIMRRESASTTSAWGAWVQVGSLTTGWSSDTTFTFADMATAADRLYTYRLTAVNSAGSTNSSDSDVIRTTPASPGVPAAALDAFGDITVTASVTGINAAGATYDWESRINGVEAAVAGTTVQPVRVFAGVDPLKSYAYRLRSSTSSGTSNDTTLYSNWSSWSNTVAQVGPPLAPTPVFPASGATVAFDRDFTWAWTHNPIDTSPQRTYQLRYRIDGDEWVTFTGTTARARAQEALGPGSFGEWQVRTTGKFTASPEEDAYGPWSTVQPFTLAATPQVTIFEPASIYTKGTLTARWAFFAEDSSVQAAWEASLWDVATGAQLGGTRFGTQETYVTFSSAGQGLADGMSYEVRVRVRATSGLWSDAETRTFETFFTPPTAPILDVTYDCDTGSTALDLRCQGPLQAQDVFVATNLALNPSFEALSGSAVANVTPVNATLSRSDSWAESGDYALKIAPNASGQYAAASVAGGAVSMSGNGVTFVAGNTYTLIATCALLAAQTGTLGPDARRIVVSGKVGAGDREVFAASTPVPNEPGAYLIQLEFSVPAGATACEIEFWNGAELGGGDVFWDAFAVVEGDYPGEWFDGDRAPNPGSTTFWDGSPHASTSALYSARLNARPEGPNEHVTDTTARASIQRRSGDTAPWVTVWEGEECTVTFTDHTHPVGGQVCWRAVAYSPQDAWAASGPDCITFSRDAACATREGLLVQTSDAYLSVGVGWGRTVRLNSDLEIAEVAYGAEQNTAVHFAGRPWATLFSGTQMVQEIQVQFSAAPEDNDVTCECGIEPATTLEDIRPFIASAAAGGFDGPRLWRDADGRRFLVGVEPMNVAHLGKGWYSVTLNLFRVDSAGRLV